MSTQLQCGSTEVEQPDENDDRETVTCDLCNAPLFEHSRKAGHSTCDTCGGRPTGGA